MAEPHSQAFIHKNGCYLLYNPQLMASPPAGILHSGELLQGKDVQWVESGGRGQAWFIKLGDVHAVLRAYQRGGLLSYLNKSTYLGVNVDKSRAFREWRLLDWMYHEGLPVPRPIAASLCRWPVPFGPFYRAHILLQKIEDTQTLDHRLSESEIDQSIWQKIGECIAIFHRHNIFHADLNANNILLDKQSNIFLIDFDKSEVRDGNAGSSWKEQNLQRLKRSLLKQQGIHTHYHFSDTDWQSLYNAYISLP